MQFFSKKCLVGDLVVFECFYFGVVGEVVVWRKFLVVSENLNLATLFLSARSLTIFTKSHEKRAIFSILHLKLSFGHYQYFSGTTNIESLATPLLVRSSIQGTFGVQKHSVNEFVG